jgi:hypothetical protein
LGFHDGSATLVAIKPSLGFLIPSILLLSYPNGICKRCLGFLIMDTGKLDNRVFEENQDEGEEEEDTK